MEQGVAAGYDKLAELLASTLARGAIAGRYRARADGLLAFRGRKGW